MTHQAGGLGGRRLLRAQTGWPSSPSVHGRTVTFTAPIVGVIWTATGLNA